MTVNLRRDTGSGICELRRKEDLIRSLREYKAVFQAEIGAIETWIEEFGAGNVTDKYIQICIGIQASIKADSVTVEHEDLRPTGRNCSHRTSIRENV